jgi:hypothetical protein
MAHPAYEAAWPPVIGRSRPAQTLTPLRPFVVRQVLTVPRERVSERHLNRNTLSFWLYCIGVFLFSGDSISQPAAIMAIVILSQYRRRTRVRSLPLTPGGTWQRSLQSGRQIPAVRASLCEGVLQE